MLRFTKNKRLLKVSISLCLGLVFSLANCSPARAVDGLFNGKFLTGENDDFVLWLQSYDQANSPYYNDLFFLNKAGNVGLGITNPSATLDIFGKAKITNNGIIYNQDSLRWLDMTGTLVDSLKVAKDIYSTAGVLKTDGTGNNYMLGKLGLGISSPAGRLHLEGGDLFLSNGNYYNSAGARYGGKISLFSSLKGRQVNNNPDFLEGLNNYNVYDNASSGTVSLSLVSDSTAPNSSGRVMRLSVSGTGATPGRGGFYKATPLCGGTAVGHCLRQGNRHVIRIWAKIPADSSIQYASNSMGTGGSFQWISSRAGTGEWEEYIGQETMGAGAATTNFFYVADGAVPLTWDVASVEIIDIDSLADVDRAASLNVGYKNDIVLGDGNLLSTAGSYFAVDSGNVGIGLTNPSSKLQINPGTNTEGLRIITSNYSPFVIRNASDTADIFRIDQNGNITGGIGNSSAWTRNNATNQLYVSNINDKVGIGTTNPFLGQLHVNKGTAAGLGGDLWITNNAVNTTGNSARLSFGLDNTTDVSSNAFIQATVTNSSGFLTDLTFGTYGVGALAERMRINSSGNVSIGGNLNLTAGGTIYNSDSSRWLDLSGAITSASLVVPHSIKTEQQFISTIANGTAPLLVNSNTLVSNLNADLLDGSHAADFQKVQVKNILKTDLNPTSGTFWYCLGTLNAITNGTKTDLTIESMNGADSPRIIDASIFTAYTSGRINVVQNMALSHSGAMSSWGTYKILVTSDNKVWLYYVGSTQAFNLKVTVKSSNFTFAPTNEVVYTEPTTVVSTLTLADQLIVAPNLNITAKNGIFAALVSPKWYPSADSVSALQINKADGVTNIFNIDTTNSRIGIGINLPTKKLDVDGDLLVRNAATFSSSITLSSMINSGNRILMIDNSGVLYSTSSSIATGLPSPSGISGQTLRSNGASWIANNLLYNNGTNVGIGTTAPQSKLQVVGNASIANGITGVPAWNNYTLELRSSGSDKVSLEFHRPGYSSAQIYSDDGSIAFGTQSGAEQVRITSAGNVGIGTTAPSKKLEIYGGDLKISSASNGYFYSGQDFLGTYWEQVGNNVNNEGIRFQSSKSGDGSNYSQFFIDPTSGFSFTKTGTGNGNVGIGITNPGYKLQVAGEGSFLNGDSASQVHGVSTPTQLTDTANKSYVDDSLVTKLTAMSNSSAVDVNTLGDNFLLYGGPTGTWLNRGPSGHNGGAILHVPTHPGGYYSDLWFDTANNRVYTRATNATAIGGWDQLITASTLGASSGWIVNGTTIYNSNSGNVGISTTNPLAKLQIGTDYTGEPITLGTLTPELLVMGAQNSTSDDSVLRLVRPTTPSVAYPASVDFKIKRYDATYPYPRTQLTIGLKASGSYDTGDVVDVLTLRDNGNVGIGTTTPSASLDIFGNFKITSGGLVYNTNSSYRFNFSDIFGDHNSLIAQGDINTAGVLETAGTDRPNYMLGKLGIGTSNPLSILDVSGNNTTSTIYPIISRNITNTVAAGGNVGIKFNLSADVDGVNKWVSIESFDTSNWGSNGGLSFTTNNAYTKTKSMVIDHLGSVGINTTAPGAAYKLDVAGKINTSGGVAGGFCIGGDCIDSWGDVIGTFNSSTPLTVGNLTVSTIVMNQSGGLGNILNVRKLTVGTIDPLYRIDGTNYSSFAAAIVGGVKEEYLGRVKISKLNDAKEYEYRLDFAKLSAPDELWVWRQTVDFSPENVEVSLTPYGAFASTYYIIEDEAIIFRADKPITVSYRLSGKRLDWQNWPTEAKDQQEKPSFIINNKKLIK